MARRSSTSKQQPVPEPVRKAIVVLAGVKPELYTTLHETMLDVPVSLKMVQGGFELIDAFGHSNVDIIVLNDPLPDFSVLKLLKRIRRFPGLINSMVILLSAAGTADNSVEFFEAGVDKLLSQPVAPNEFHAEIMDLLETSRGAEMGEDADDLAGNLEVIGIVEVLQLLNAGRKSGILNCHTRRGMCSLALNKGEIIHALYGPISGPDAVYSVMKETMGHFSFKLQKMIEVPTNIKMNFATLLLEGMRRSDEIIRQSSSKFMVQSGGATGEETPAKDQET